MDERAIAEINLQNLNNNIKRIKGYIPKKTKVMPVIKANAYGHGAIKVVEELLKSKIYYYAVATIDEAVELKKKFKDINILILGYCEKSRLKDLFLYDITQTVIDYESAKYINDYGKKIDMILKVHIKLDSGMNRLGFKQDLIEHVLNISKLEYINIEGIFTHLYNADCKDTSDTKKQVDMFNKNIEILKNNNIDISIKHISNSGGILVLENDEIYDYVRPGIMIYGINDKIDFKEVMQFKTKVIHIKKVKKYESIGYDASYVAKKDMKIAILSVGYADGLNRKLSNKGRVILNNKYANIVGKVCMDYTMIDISDIKDVNIGDEVILFGKSFDKEIKVKEVANLCDTISYEILCSISARVVRKYI